MAGTVLKHVSMGRSVGLVELTAGELGTRGTPEIRKTEARIRIVLRDGTTLDKHVEHALGTIERPLSDADIEAKFHGLVEGVLSPTQADTLARLAWDVASLDDAAAIASAAVP